MVKTRKAGTRAGTGYADAYGSRTKIETNNDHQNIINLIELIGNWENGITDIEVWEKSINQVFQKAKESVINGLFPKVEDLKKAREILAAKEILRKHGLTIEQ